MTELTFLEEFFASPLNELEAYRYLRWLVAKGQAIRTKDRREGRYIYAHVAADAT